MAAELEPTNVNFHDALGIMLCDQKHDYDAVIDCFRKVLELDPRHARAQTNLAVALIPKPTHDRDTNANVVSAT